MLSSESAPPTETAGGTSATRPSLWLAVCVLIVRLRFFLVLLAALLLVGTWPTVRRYWLRLGGAAIEPRAAASDVEFWCSMCPGVVSDFPGKCPVCNMALVQRTKRAATPLPNGVLARMQFSPYRLQLAGIRTVVAEYRPLHREVVLVGLVQRSSFSTSVGVRAEVFAAEFPFLTEGQAVEANCEALAGHAPFRGRIKHIEGEMGADRRTIAVRMEIGDPGRDLRSGLLMTARAEAPLARLPWWQRAVTEEAGKDSAAELALQGLLTPTIPGIPGSVWSVLNQAGRQALFAQGYELAVPCSAVIDRGSRKVVFVESGIGMFDAVQITIGPRCGDYYPVLRGLAVGQCVAATGAFLLDAEMGLDRGLAATYFGATGGSSPQTPAAPVSPGSLSAEDQLLAAKQKICPVTGAPLDSMGGPVRLVVQGRVVFVCCKSCEGPLRKNPAKYLANVPAK